MDQFPAEFEDLLNRKGRRLFRDPEKLESLLHRRRTPILFFNDVVDTDVSRHCIRLLDDALYPVLRRMHIPIPRTALTGMRKNYAEQLPKNVRVRTALLNWRRSKAREAARQVGLEKMMASASLLRLAQSVTRFTLRRDWWGQQAICYENGDYSGPHNDHHPESGERTGFLDFHLMFSNDSVSRQLLVYEENGFLSAAHEVTGKPSIAIYRLPFWHYTTPLMARPGRELTARRWLLLGTFAYDPPLPKLSYHGDS